jgi:hypothetical protein
LFDLVHQALLAEPAELLRNWSAELEVIELPE